MDERTAAFIGLVLGSAAFFLSIVALFMAAAAK